MGIIAKYMSKDLIVRVLFSILIFPLVTAIFASKAEAMSSTKLVKPYEISVEVHPDIKAVSEFGLHIYCSEVNKYNTYSEVFSRPKHIAPEADDSVGSCDMDGETCKKGFELGLLSLLARTKNKIATPTPTKFL